MSAASTTHDRLTELNAPECGTVGGPWTCAPRRSSHWPRYNYKTHHSGLDDKVTATAERGRERLRNFGLTARVANRCENTTHCWSASVVPNLLPLLGSCSDPLPRGVYEGNAIRITRHTGRRARTCVDTTCQTDDVKNVSYCGSLNNPIVRSNFKHQPAFVRALTLIQFSQSEDLSSKLHLCRASQRCFTRQQ